MVSDINFHKHTQSLPCKSKNKVIKNQKNINSLEEDKQLIMRSISLILSPRSSRDHKLKTACYLVEQARWLTRAKKQGSEASETPSNILLRSISATKAEIDSSVTSSVFNSSLSVADDRCCTAFFPLSTGGEGPLRVLRYA